MPPSTHVSRPIRFGVFEVDPHAGELRKQGLKLKLAGQPFDVLAMLLERPGEIVTREEIQKKLWPADTFVDFDHSLNTAVNKIREALGDDANNPRFVETVPRRGYRFIYPVETPRRGVSTAGPETEAAIFDRRKEPAFAERRYSARRVALAGASLVAVVAILIAFNVAGLRDRLFRATPPAPKIESIAVLPLDNLSGDPEQEYFADGMTDALITDLGKISALRVISRNSVMRYKGQHKPSSEIARELSVDGIVERAVLRSGERVRITAQLIDARADRHLWAESYDRDLGDVLSLQGEVARAIAQQVQAKLTPQEQTRLAKSRRVNPDAHLAYLKGRYYTSRWPEEEFGRCIDYFQQAIEKDPSYAEAYAGLSSCHAVTIWLQPPKEVFPRIKAAAAKALEIDETESEGHAELGFVRHFYDWDWPAAEREAKRAIDLEPSSIWGHLLYSDCLLTGGQFDEAVAEAREALDLDPLSLMVNRVLTFTYILARRYDEALAQAGIGLELDPDYAMARYDLAWAYALKGRHSQALAEAQKIGDLYISLAYGPYIYAISAEREEALGWIAKSKEFATQHYVDPFNFAVQYALIGNDNEAFEWLMKAYEEKSPMMVQLKVNPCLDNLRSDPRFQDLLRRMNFPP